MRSTGLSLYLDRQTELYGPSPPSYPIVCRGAARRVGKSIDCPDTMAHLDADGCRPRRTRIASRETLSSLDRVRSQNSDLDSCRIPCLRIGRTPARLEHRRTPWTVLSRFQDDAE